MNTPLSPQASRARTLVLVAFAIVYTVWGSTYMAIRVAVETLPPFLLSGVRFVFAGTVLLAWLRFRRVALPSRTEWRHAAVSGTLVLAGGNAVVVWAEQTIPSSVAALVVALTPVWFAVLEWVRPNGTRPTPSTVAGILVGFAGVILLVSGRQAVHTAGGVNYRGLMVLVTSGIFWAAGSLWSRYHPRAESPWMNSAAQMICGGVASLLVAVVLGEPGHFHLDRVSLHSVEAFLYLVVFGSWLGYSAYIYLLKATTPARLATYAYVNPVIAVLLGWLVLGESLNGRMLGAAAVILAGVAITTLGGRR